MHLDKFVPVGGWASSGRDRRRFERFAEMCQDLPNRPRLWCKEMSRMSPPHAGHSSGNFSPTRAISLDQAIREVSWERGFWFAWFASQHPPVAWSSLACPPVAASRCFPTFPFRQSRDGRPQRVVRSEDAVIPVPVFPRLQPVLRRILD